MKTLLKLQDMDLKIEALKGRELEIPKQKNKFEIHRKRLAMELQESEQRWKKLMLEQREIESDIETKQALIKKYDTQLLAVKKNEEYQALLHEIEIAKKQISVKEERVIAIMMEVDEARELFEEDKKRITEEVTSIDQECKKIDAELDVAMKERKQVEAERNPLETSVNALLLSRYKRIRKSKKEGAAVVPLRGETCSGCNMKVTAQIVNEILADDKIHACQHCGRLLYAPENLENNPA